MIDRREIANYYKEKRDNNRTANIAIAHGVRVNGTYFEHGVPNPGTALKRLRGAGVAISQEARTRKAILMQRDIR